MLEWRAGCAGRCTSGSGRRGRETAYRALPLTSLKGPATWQYFYLYVILDLFSRYVVGWMVAERESAVLAKQLISQTCAKHAISQDELTLHADRGSSMKSKLAKNGRPPGSAGEAAAV